MTANKGVNIAIFRHIVHPEPGHDRKNPLLPVTYPVEGGEHPVLRGVLQQDLLVPVEKVEGGDCPDIVQEVGTDDEIRVIAVVPAVRINVLVAVPCLYVLIYVYIGDRQPPGGHHGAEGSVRFKGVDYVFACFAPRIAEKQQGIFRIYAIQRVAASGFVHEPEVRRR